MTERGLSIEERFWRKVDKKGDDTCWNWVSKARTRRGYGCFYVKPGSQCESHRMAYRLTYGDDSVVGLEVRHKCDNPSCCNPRHLELGTHADNVHDMDSRGRRRSGDRKGTKNPAAKLTEEIVLELRRLYESGISLKELAAKFGLSKTSIWQTATRKNWTHI